MFDVPVQVSAVLGRARMEVGDLLKLGPGTVLELDRKVGEAIDIYVNNRLVARGEVVLVEDKLGVTMTEIIKAERGLMSARSGRKRKETTMRLLIVGTLKGQLTTATKIAMDRGATVTHAADIAQALAVLRSGRGADLLMVDVALDIRDLVRALEAEHIHVPIVACGTATDARAAVAAIHAGAKEYIPLPPDPELIAAVLAAVADDTRELIYRDEAMARVVKLAQQIAPQRRLGADHRRIRHRQGGAGALRARAARTAPRSRSSASIAPPSRKRCSNPSCSATRRARSPARSPAASASSRRPTAARCCSTKSPRWTCGCRPSSCARSRSA